MTILAGDIEEEAVATALAAAGGKDLELLGADVAAQALARGLVDEILVYLLPVVLGGGVRSRPRAAWRSTWSRSAAGEQAPPRCCASGSGSSPFPMTTLAELLGGYVAAPDRGPSAPEA